MGKPFPKPLARTREYIDIIRQVMAREAPVTNPGPHYPLPYDGDNGTGLGKPLKSIVHPLRNEIPIYMGAEGPQEYRAGHGGLPTAGCRFSTIPMMKVYMQSLWLMPGPILR